VYNKSSPNELIFLEATPKVTNGIINKKRNNFFFHNYKQLQTISNHNFENENLSNERIGA
jgi:hypothetical protein